MGELFINNNDYLIPEGSYYREWYRAQGDVDLWPFYSEDWTTLIANQEDGNNSYLNQPLADWPYAHLDYYDVHGVWNNNDTLTYKTGMENLLLQLYWQRKNVVGYDFDVTHRIYTWNIYKEQRRIYTVSKSEYETNPIAPVWQGLPIYYGWPTGMYGWPGGNANSPVDPSNYDEL